MLGSRETKIRDKILGFESSTVLGGWQTLQLLSCRVRAVHVECWYRWSREKRSIRLLEHRPGDVLPFSFHKISAALQSGPYCPCFTTHHFDVGAVKPPLEEGASDQSFGVEKKLSRRSGGGPG